jgi:hypothetical protein
VTVTQVRAAKRGGGGTSTSGLQEVAERVESSCSVLDAYEHVACWRRALFAAGRPRARARAHTGAHTCTCVHRCVPTSVHAALPPHPHRVSHACTSHCHSAATRQHALGHATHMHVVHVYILQLVTAHAHAAAQHTPQNSLRHSNAATAAARLRLQRGGGWWRGSWRGGRQQPSPWAGMLMRCVPFARRVQCRSGPAGASQSSCATSRHTSALEGRQYSDFLRVSAAAHHVGANLQVHGCGLERVRARA